MEHIRMRRKVMNLFHFSQLDQLVLILLIFLASSNVCDCSNLTTNEKQYPLRLQPELDVIDVSKYLLNPRLLNFQMKCLLFNGVCDVVGKWMKPRAKAGLLGECILCTEVQKGWLNKWLEVLIDTRPDLYRAGIAKYLQNTGIAIPQDELLNTKRVLEAVDKLQSANETINAEIQ